MPKKNSLKKNWLVLLTYLAVGNISAQYISVSDQINYRICKEGNGQDKVTEGGFAHLRITASAAGKSLFNEKYWFKIDEEARRNSLHNVLKRLSAGDSAEIILPYQLILESLVNLPRIKGVKAKDKITLNVRVLRAAKADPSDRDYEQFVKQQEQNAQRYMSQYLKNNPSFEKRKSGIYVNLLRSGGSRRLGKSGSVALITYTGCFLNGIKFDNTPKSGAFRYVQGVQFQMIQGIVMTLAEMSEGAKAQIVIPPRYAFGGKGLADIVPPFAPVVYDIEILKVE